MKMPGCDNRIRMRVGINIIDSTGESYTIKYWNHGPFMSVTAYGENGKLIYHYRDFSIGLLIIDFQTVCEEADNYKKTFGYYPRFSALKDFISNKFKTPIFKTPLYQALEDNQTKGTPGSIIYYSCSLSCGSKIHIVAIGENGNTLQGIDK